MSYRRFAIALVIVLCAFSVQAQSGRRQSKPAPAAPVPTPTPEPTPIPKKEDKAPDLFFFLGADRNSSYDSFPYSYYDAALAGCSDRLRGGSSASVNVSDRGLSRGEAIKKAKSESDSYVVILSLSYESMARSADDLVLEFLVFAPGTAKIVMNGRSYVNGDRRAGPIIVGPNSRGSTSGLYREQLIKRAGEEAGNRILKALHLNVEIPRRP
jgi:hypothetical protein